MDNWSRCDNCEKLTLNIDVEIDPFRDMVIFYYTCDRCFQEWEERYVFGADVITKKGREYNGEKS